MSLLRLSIPYNSRIFLRRVGFITCLVETLHGRYGCLCWGYPTDVSLPPFSNHLSLFVCIQEDNTVSSGIILSEDQSEVYVAGHTSGIIPGFEGDSE